MNITKNQKKRVEYKSIAIMNIFTIANLHYAEGSSEREGVLHQTPSFIIKTSKNIAFIVINRSLATFQNPVVSIAYSTVKLGEERGNSAIVF